MMKRLFAIFLVISLLIPTGLFAKDLPSMFVGGYYQDAISLTFGASKSLGGNFYAVGYAEAGEDNVWELTPEVMFLPIKGQFWLGVLLGPSFVIENPPDAPSLERIIGGTGLAVGYWFKEYIGIWVAGKYKFELPEGNYENKLAIGLGLSLSFDISLF